VVVSSVTPMILAALRVYQVGSSASLALIEAYRQRSSSLFGSLISEASFSALWLHQQRRVAAVVQDHVRAFAFAALGPEFEDAVGVVPVVGEGLALDREDRRAGFGDGRGGVVLGREDVARGPAHLRAQRFQRLDQHGGLDGHVQRAGDARTFQRLRLRELVADGHQAGHLGLGDPDFLAAPGGKRQVGDDVVGVGFEDGSVHVRLQNFVRNPQTAAREGLRISPTCGHRAGERGCN
jgi:hypothetical protein